MNIDLVSNNINNIVKIGLTNGDSLEKIMVDLQVRKLNISKLLSKEKTDLTYLANIPFKYICLEELDITHRGLYALYFIIVAKEKIEDLFWMKDNSHKFQNKTLIELHNLIEFKKKLKTKSKSS